MSVSLEKRQYRVSQKAVRRTSISPDIARNGKGRGSRRWYLRRVKLVEGKRALVTGVANRWSIATGIARKLHEHGARLALAYQGERVRDEVEKLAKELDGAHVVECDVASDESLAAMRSNLAEHFGPIDALVHSIAFANKADLAGKVFDTSRSGFALSLDVSSYSLIALVSALRDGLNDGASVVALTYLGATQIVPNYNLMGISKAALESIVRYLAYDLGDRGIRVNAISAGPIKTASSRQVGGFRAFSTSCRRSPRCAATSLRKTSAMSPYFSFPISRRRLPPTCISSTPATT